jgi:DNA-binding CsgD family transcriptional regulator/tetratricopeptide (TPR) repeat protein
VGLLERDAFLEQLDGVLSEAARQRGRLVLVRGEAGIGKTTLVEAFTAGRGSRVLWGTCDPLEPPLPLAPVLDIADQAGAGLRSALEEGDRHRIISALLAVLRAEGGPWILVLEDMHWADEATLEVLRVLGRRVAQLPAVIIATIRGEEVQPGHRLSTALGDIPASATLSITLPPLSAVAVEELATGTTIDPVALHRASAGNPFFVTEVLATGGFDMPATVRDAVWARACRLGPAALRIMRAASVLGPRCEAAVLSMVGEAPAPDIDECVDRGLLRRDGSLVEFRHELSQRAILESLAASERTLLHERALSVLRERAYSVEPAELARHAVEAADPEAILELAPRAAQRASALGAHRAARAHYEAALGFADRLPDAQRAALLAAHASECNLNDDAERAVASQSEALACWRKAGDVGAQGRALSALAEYLWWDGHADRAEEAANEAVALLESVDADRDVARAYAKLAQVLMMSGQFAPGAEWGYKALTQGEQLGEEAVVVHALNTVGVCETRAGPGAGLAKLEESLRRARAADLEEETARAFNNLIAIAREERRYDLVDRYMTEAVAFFNERDLDAAERCLIGDYVEALFDQGRWSEAASEARAVVDRAQRHGRPQSLAVLGRLAARRGEPDATRWLDAAREEDICGESVFPLRAARAEAAWLAGDLRLAAREVEAGLPALGENNSSWEIGELAFWAYKLGIAWECPRPPAEPYALYLAGHPDKAAAAWAAIGCPYQQAQCLAETGDPTQINEALVIFQTLGAGSAAKLAADSLRSMGVRRISRGPRRATRENPAGLSDREVEVLTLLAEGLRNTEIAERLVLSTRTVDHHVSAILTKLGVRSRYEAGQAAMGLGIKAESG